MFGAQIATRSPGSMPEAISARAARVDLRGELGERQAHVAVDERLAIAEPLGGAAQRHPGSSAAGRPSRAARMSVRMAPNKTNDKIYIHELIDIAGQNRASTCTT